MKLLGREILLSYTLHQNKSHGSVNNRPLATLPTTYVTNLTNVPHLPMSELLEPGPLLWRGPK